MKLNRLLFILLISLFFFSCSPQKRLNRKVERTQKFARKHGLMVLDSVPYTDTIRDTIRVTTEVVKLDTIFSLNEIHDTITITKDNLTIRYYHDTVHDKIYIQGECDSIFIEVPYEKIIEIMVPCETMIVEENIKWWYWIILILILAASAWMAKELLKLKKS